MLPGSALPLAKRLRVATDPAYPRMAPLIRTADQLADGTLVDGYQACASRGIADKL